MSLNNIVEPLLRWYESEHRILPWRESKNPYYIWISEIMLQQTRVEAVKPYFERFIQTFPTIHAVACADEEQLLKMWEGLGYYNRVRNIQKAAKTVVEKYEGKLPADYDELKTLSGIGNYTAGAVASIAYGIPAPAVDGNVLRVISRIEERTEDIMKQSTRKSVEEAVMNVIPQQAAGDFNQALMELGAMVCVPNGAPYCEKCPISEFCGAYQHDRIEELPVKSGKKSRRVEERTIVLIQDGDKVALRKRPSTGLLAGLYEFPNLEGHLSEEEVLRFVEEEKLMPLHIRPLQEAKHIFSHVEWRMIGYAVKVAALEEKKQGKMLFVDQKETEDEYTIPAAYGAYTKYMNIRLGQKKYEGD